jgi:hypothetical protein
MKLEGGKELETFYTVSFTLLMKLTKAYKFVVFGVFTPATMKHRTFWNAMH